MPVDRKRLPCGPLHATHLYIDTETHATDSHWAARCNELLQQLMTVIRGNSIFGRTPQSSPSINTVVTPKKTPKRTLVYFLALVGRGF